MNDINKFRLGFILLLIFGSICVYSFSPMIGYVLLGGWKTIDWTPRASQTPIASLLPIWVTIPSSFLFIYGFLLFFRTDEQQKVGSVE